MKILLFITAFLFSSLSLFPQTYSIVNGSVYSISIENIVIEVENTKNNARVFDPGNEIHLTEPWGISATKDKSRGHIFFSNKMHVWLGGSSTIWIDNFEQFVDKDENGKVVLDYGSFVANLRVNGKVEFLLRGISESGYFGILTNGADLEIKSKHFSLFTEKNFTTIECYEGEISLTNSSTLKSTVVKSGQQAVAWGKDGEMNLSVEVKQIEPERMAIVKEKTRSLKDPVWNIKTK